MKTSVLKVLGAAAIGLTMGLSPGLPAFARDHHHHFHSRTSVFVGIGDPFWPWYDPFYYAPVVVVPTAPPTYIEQGDASESSSDQSSWYYCERSQAYYPYVKDCPAGWKQVAPTPPPSQ
jgi:hypothetical protein